MIPRVTKAEFREFFESDRPAIVVDVVKDWPACKSWSPEYLSAKLRGKAVGVTLSGDGNFSYRQSQDVRSAIGYSVAKMPFEDAVSLVNRPERGRYAYIQQCALDDLPEIAGDLGTPEWIPTRPGAALWFGSRTVTPLHYDHVKNLYAQITGTKEFTIFSPRDLPHLYPFPMSAAMNHISHVDPDAVDYAKFPRYRLANPIRFTIQPGELLFLPAFWWHHVRARGLAISVSYWWEAELGDYLNSPNSMRDFYPRYANDRLRGTKRDSLDPIGLSLADAAATLLGANHRWGASLMAVAAFDEFVNALRDTAGVPNTPGCPLANIGPDIDRSRALLVERNALRPEQVAIANHIVAMAHELNQGNEVDVPLDATRWLVDAVQRLPARAAAVLS